MIVASAQSYVPILTFASAAAYLAAAGVCHGRAKLSRTGAVLLGVAALLHAVVIGLGLTSPPRFGFGPALSMTAWLALLAYAVESINYPLMQLRWRLAVTGAVTVLLAWLFPGSPLKSATSELLPLHLALGLASYGLFAVAVWHAWLMTRAEARMREGPALLRDESADEGPKMLPLLTLERLTFRFVTLGFVLLTITILQGWFYSEHLYGAVTSSHWRWSHKTIFSLLSWVVFAALLWGRHSLGWRGQRAVRMVYAGAGLLLLSYVGYHFMLEVVLHRG
ncbi:MAG: cytochrome c biogenesis protein CcsA [Brachymonas denitrificans]|uniref:cytochrome C assembly family protein n=1 Tax=Brachymonas denitrificans TaxID=28220 RepID=UPI001BCCD227|nr:cytochrome c biogenesis protein CcsA [Brachymonas denitrificans]